MKRRKVELCGAVAARFLMASLFLVPWAQAQLAGSPGVADKSGTQGVNFSTAYIDATVSTLNTSSGDICKAIFNALSQISSNPTKYLGTAVIDTRGFGMTSSQAITCGSSSNKINPWWNGSTASTVPSTILLPAGTIKIYQTWTLPSGTRLIGQGGEDPKQNPNSVTRTTIQANGSGFCIESGGTCTSTNEAPVIAMGVASPCNGVAIEDLVVDGNAQSDRDGIDNYFCADQSYVKNVTLYRVTDNGINVCQNNNPSPACTASTNSGPYTNITFDTGGAGGIGGTTYGVYLNVPTRGVQGLTCTTDSNPMGGATCLYVSATAPGNAIRDVRIEGFQYGVDVYAGNTVLMDIDGDTNPKSNTSTLNVVRINSTATQDVILMGISNNCSSSTYCSGANLDTNDLTVDDTITGAKLSVSAAPFVSMYVLGDSPTSGPAMHSYYSTVAVPSSASSVQPVPSWSAGNGAPPSGTCAAGSLYSNNSNSGTGLYVCSSIQTDSSENPVYQTWLPVL